MVLKVDAFNYQRTLFSEHGVISPTTYLSLPHCQKSWEESPPVFLGWGSPVLTNLGNSSFSIIIGSGDPSINPSIHGICMARKYR